MTRRADMHAELDALLDVHDAIEHLKQARALLARAKAPRTLRKVREAIRSAEGAQRNIRGRIEA